MEILPKWVNFVTFAWVLVAASTITFVSVFNLKRSRDWGYRKWAEIKCALSDERNAAKAQAELQTLQPRGDEKVSNWAYSAPLIRFCLITFPILEIHAIAEIFSLQKDSALQNSEETSASKGPKTTPHRSASRPASIVKPPKNFLWEEHFSKCQTCRKNLVIEPGDRRNSSLCTIGRKLIQERVKDEISEVKGSSVAERHAEIPRAPSVNIRHPAISIVSPRPSHD